MKSLTNWRKGARYSNGSSSPRDGDEETGHARSSASGAPVYYRRKSGSVRLRGSAYEAENVGPEGARRLRISVTRPPPPDLRTSAIEPRQSSAEHLQLHRATETSQVDGEDELLDAEGFAAAESRDARGRRAKVEPAHTDDMGHPLLSSASGGNCRRATAMHAKVETSSLQQRGGSLGVFGPCSSSIEEQVYDASSMRDADDLQQSSSVFGSFLDLTTERLLHIFGEFDRDGEGRVSYESLRQGLLHWAGIHIDSDGHFEKLIAVLDEDGSHDISFDEFEGGVRLLLMQQLFSEDDLDTGGGKQAIEDRHVFMPALVVVDYNALSVRKTKVATAEHMHEFMFSKREDWVHSRWIDAYGCENGAVTLKRLAVKYRLHPLALEAAISPGQRTKVDKYSTHYCIIAPLFSFETVVPAESAKDRKKAGSSRVLTVGDKVSYLCVCCGNRNTSKKSTVAVKKHLRVKIENVCMFICGRGSPSEESLMACDTLITFQREQPKEETWERVLRELGKSYAKLRQYDVQYLAYVILDDIVDRIFPVVNAFRSSLDEERERMVRDGFLDMPGLYEHKEQLQQMIRSIRLLGRMLTHVIEDDEICEGVTLYLREVRDNTESVEDDVRTLISNCENLEAEFEKMRSQQAERTLYRLSVISSIFLPAQFLTGVFGMNFDHMPELHWAYSYYVFWVLCIAVMFPALLYFGCGRVS